MLAEIKHVHVVRVSGARGRTATIEIGEVVTGVPGSMAEVTNSGSRSAAVLDFVIPTGDSVELRVYEGIIQWKRLHDGDDEWQDIVSIADLQRYSNYAVCSTEGDVAEKSIDILNFSLDTGKTVVVKFENANTAENPTLNVSGTGARPITYQGETFPSEYISAGGIYFLVYDGENWEIYIGAQLAADWATKMDGTVDGENYSAKKYALDAKEYATNVKEDAEIAAAAAERAEKHADEYIPFSFGRFRIEDNGDLSVDYYGDAGEDDIKFDDQGNVIVYSSSSPKINLGKGRIVFCGEYDETREYGYYDCVKYDGHWWLYINIEKTTGFAPIESEYWMVFGEKGDTATVTVGTVSTVPPSSPASVSNSGDEHDAVLDFEIPQGQPASITIGTVTTGRPGTEASVSNSGTEGDVILDFVIPRGDTGEVAASDVMPIATTIIILDGLTSSDWETITECCDGGTAEDWADIEVMCNGRNSFVAKWYESWAD